MTLMTGDHEPFYDEERMYLYSAIDDMRFARSFLRRLGQPERDRFSKVGFAYGDSSYFGHHPYEVYEEQLNNLLYTLFGDGFSGDLISVPVYDDDDNAVLADITTLEGGPIQVEEDYYFAGADYEEVLITEIRAYATGQRPTRQSRRKKLGELITALRRTHGEGYAPKLHRWHEESERLISLRDLDESTETVLFVNGCETYAATELLHETIFERLIRAWAEMPGHLCS